MKRTYGLEKEFTPLGAEGLLDEWCKNCHLSVTHSRLDPEYTLRILPTQDKTQIKRST